MLTHGRLIEQLLEIEPCFFETILMHLTLRNDTVLIILKCFIYNSVVVAFVDNCPTYVRKLFSQVTANSLFY